MIIDFQDAPDAVFEARYDAVVCGSGPAGMTVAREVAARGGRVLMLEGGGLSLSAESQAVYQGRSVGSVPYYGVEACRLRYLGGTSGHWAGRCAVFDPIDFEQRDIFDLPSWPITRDEVYRRLDEAKAILDLAPGDLAEPSAIPGFAPGTFRLAPYAMSKPTRFGTKYRDELDASEAITTIVNANVTDLTLADGGGRVESADVTGYGGATRRAVGDRFVVAFGAMENARFLLNCNKQQTSGIGNGADMVGRTFMEHFEVDFGRFFATDDAFWATQEDGKLAILPTEATMRARGLGNATVALKQGEPPRFYGRLAPLRKRQRDVTCASPALLGWARGRSEFQCPGEGQIGTIMEQVPNKASRVFLQDGERDRFGQRRLALALELAEADKRTLTGLAEETGKMLARTDTARLKVYDGAYDASLEFGGHCHHMGTTRMSDSPRDGVVDRDCRVHGVANLYMGGASVFSTGGGVNPTLTIVSLALRLGEHIGSEIGRA